jgi:hypothetical protein
MRKSVLMAVTALAALSAAVLAGSRAEAVTIGSPAGLGIAADRIDAVQDAQYVYGGRNHCWYPTGWHGAGWYWCGYRWRRGLGWGGPAGYQGWSYAPPAVVVAPRRPPPPPPRRVIVVPR